MRGLIALLLVPLAACDGPRASEQDTAKALIAGHCAACHTVPGVPTATGRVGPSLAGIERQQILAGHFANTPANMARWVAHAQTMLPGDAMPNTGLTDAQAKIVVDYLYTLD